VAARTPVSEGRYQSAMETVKARRSAKTTAANTAKRDVRRPR
jgi:hypothetical protein